MVTLIHKFWLVSKCFPGLFLLDLSMSPRWTPSNKSNHENCGTFLGTVVLTQKGNIFNLVFIYFFVFSKKISASLFGSLLCVDINVNFLGPKRISCNNSILDPKTVYMENCILDPYPGERHFKEVNGDAQIFGLITKM